MGTGTVLFSVWWGTVALTVWCVHMNIYVYIYVCMYCMYEGIVLYVCIVWFYCMYVLYVCMYVCMYVCNEVGNKAEKITKNQGGK